MHQKETSNKAKTPEIAKIKTSSLNNRVRCNKNTKLTKKHKTPERVGHQKRSRSKNR